MRVTYGIAIVGPQKRTGLDQPGAQTAVPREKAQECDFSPGETGAVYGMKSERTFLLDLNLCPVELQACCLRPEHGREC